MFRGTFKLDNFYFNYHIEANQVNFSPFSRFELRTPSVHRSVPPNVHLGTVCYTKSDKPRCQKLPLSERAVTVRKIKEPVFI